MGPTLAQYMKKARNCYDIYMLIGLLHIDYPITRNPTVRRFRIPGIDFTAILASALGHSSIIKKWPTSSIFYSGTAG